jgi:hypothetical protein
VSEHLRAHGNQPRHRANRLIFLAADDPVLNWLRDVTRVALAWASIVEDVNEGRLNIDQIQRTQAEKESQAANVVLPRAARECFKWLLCPVQDDPSATKPTIEPFPLNTTSRDAPDEVVTVCRENELVIETWSPIHLRSKLKELYWFASEMAPSNSMTLCCSSNLKQPSNTKRTSRSPMMAAESIRATDPQTRPPAQHQRLTPSPADRPVPRPEGDSGTTGGTATAKAKSFHGSIQIAPSAAKMRLVEVAEEIISVLASDPNASINITLEINAEFPSGVSDQTKRAVSENAKSLAFKTNSWE